MMTMKNIINPHMLLDFKILEWDDCRMEMINGPVFQSTLFYKPHSHKQSFPTICFICNIKTLGASGGTLVKEVIGRLVD